MNQVTINKAELAEIILGNRDKHRAVFLAAVDGYRDEAVRLLDEAIGRIKAGKVSQVQVYLPAPQDHTRDYDRVVRMLELEVADTVTLDEPAFARYVEDDWAWRREFLGTANTYAAASVQDVYGVDAN